MKANWDDDTLVPWRGSEPDPVVLEELEVRPAVAGELPRVAALLKEQHYLGSGAPGLVCREWLPLLSIFFLTGSLLGFPAWNRGIPLLPHSTPVDTQAGG
jgi:hypothetical protein